MKTIIKSLLILSILFTPVLAEDLFEKIKAELSEAECNQIVFLNILQSSIFDSSDSLNGSVMISSDGKYYLQTDNDIYLNDSKQLFSYSKGNNQLIIESLIGLNSDFDEILFITHLDEFFKSYIIVPDKEYKLLKRKGYKGSLPDSMILKLDILKKTISEISYFDINNEFNQILIKEIHSHLVCDSTYFLPNFPDSAETIKL